MNWRFRENVHWFSENHQKSCCKSEDMPHSFVGEFNDHYCRFLPKGSSGHPGGHELIKTNQLTQKFTKNEKPYIPYDCFHTIVLM